MCMFEIMCDAHFHTALASISNMQHQRIEISHQVVIWSDPKQLSEVAESYRGVGFKPKVWVMMGWSEVTPFTAWSKMRPTGRVKKKKKKRIKEYIRYL